MYPGWGMEEGWEGLYRYPTRTLPVPIVSLFLRLEPYLRPNEGNSRHFHEVSEIGSRIDLNIDPELIQNDLNIDPPDRAPDWSRDVLRSHISRPQIFNGP